MGQTAQALYSCPYYQDKHIRIYSVPPSQCSYESIAQQELCLPSRSCFSLDVRSAYARGSSQPYKPVLLWEGTIKGRQWWWWRRKETDTILLRMTEHEHRGGERKLYMTVDSVVISGVSSSPFHKQVVSYFFNG